MALHINLKDGEKVIVNGAVLRASGRCELKVENNVTILRGRDVMAPKEADTPARRLYFACMMAYIDDANLSHHQNEILRLIGDLLEALASPAAKAMCIDFAQKVATSNFYAALTPCRQLMDYEAMHLREPVAA